MFGWVFSEPFLAELHAGLHTLGLAMVVSILGKLWIQGLSAGPPRYVIQRFLVLSVYTFVASILIYILRNLRLYEQAILLLVEFFVLGLVDADTHYVDDPTSPADIHSQLFHEEDVIDGVDDACSASPNGDIVQTLSRILMWWHHIVDIQSWHPSNVRIEAVGVSALMTAVGVAVMYVKDVALQFKHLREDLSAKEVHPTSLLAVFALSMAGAFASAAITIASIGLGICAAGVLTCLSTLPFRWALSRLRGTGAARAAERCARRGASFLLVTVVAGVWCGGLLLVYAAKVVLKVLQLCFALGLVVYHSTGGLARQAWRPVLLAAQVLGVSSTSLASLGKSLPARWEAYRKQRRADSERHLQEAARAAAAAASPRTPPPAAAAGAAAQEARPQQQQQQQQRGIKGKKGKSGSKTAAQPPARSVPPTPPPAAPAPAPPPAAAAAPVQPRPSPAASNARGKKNKARANAPPAAASAAASPAAAQPSTSSASQSASLQQQSSSEPPPPRAPLDRASSSGSSGSGSGRNKQPRASSRPTPAIILHPPTAPEPAAPAQPQHPAATPQQPPPAAASSDSFLSRFTPGFWSRRPATSATPAASAVGSAAPSAASDSSAPVAAASSSSALPGSSSAAAAGAAATSSPSGGGSTPAPTPASTSAAAATAGGTAGAAAAADDRTCVVCLAGPRQAGLQHGSSLHMCLCRGCAGLFTPGMPCPMCRQTIDQVISDIYM